jgi:hypothetical protein
MEVSCDYCKKIFVYKGGKKHFDRTKHHYCSRSCQGNGNNVILGNNIHGLAGKGLKKDKRYSIWCNVKKRAKQKGIEFILNFEDIPEIPVVCPILGIKIKSNKISAPLDSSPSIDRINPKKGYEKNNIRIISNRANRIKADATADEIELVLIDLRRIENERV